MTYAVHNGTYEYTFINTKMQGLAKNGNYYVFRRYNNVAYAAVERRGFATVAQCNAIDTVLNKVKR